MAEEARRRRTSNEDSNLEVLTVVVYHALSKGSLKVGARMACICTTSRDAVYGDERLWKEHYHRELGGDQPPTNPAGVHLPSFSDAYRAWRVAFQPYDWMMVIRVKKCWDALRKWLSSNFSEVLLTLRPGASEDDLNLIEEYSNYKIPPPTRVLYRLCDGQNVEDGSNLGLIGGYQVYRHNVNVCLLPVNKVLEETKKLGTRSYIIVAKSTTSTPKFFALNCRSGNLVAGTRDFTQRRIFSHCVPDELINENNDQQAILKQDGFLLWMEEHVRRLQSGYIKVRGQGPTRTICQFPELGPERTTRVSDNIKIRTSSVFMPEQSIIDTDPKEYTYAYSVRMSLEPEGCIINGTRAMSCQLVERDLSSYTDDDDRYETSRGLAVVGEHPILEAGGEEFVYQSLAPLPCQQGTVQGLYKFARTRFDLRGAFWVRLPLCSVGFKDWVF